MARTAAVLADVSCRDLTSSYKLRFLPLTSSTASNSLLFSKCAFFRASSKSCPRVLSFSSLCSSPVKNSTCWFNWSISLWFASSKYSLWICWGSLPFSKKPDRRLISPSRDSTCFRSVDIWCMLVSFSVVMRISCSFSLDISMSDAAIRSLILRSTGGGVGSCMEGLAFAGSRGRLDSMTGRPADTDTFVFKRSSLIRSFMASESFSIARLSFKCCIAMNCISDN
mmetsp:Transcript_4354/g.6718  ORF Transcript_4354/g.6718 Transcript_4354/m.6718 type:complete len:225 (-) Transcript_4354:363-1037(-)